MTIRRILLTLLLLPLPALAGEPAKPVTSGEPAKPVTSGEPAKPASIVVDAGSGTVLAEDRGGQPRHPASLTKLMTVYLAFRDMAAGRAVPGAVVTVSERAATQGGSVLGLKAGARLSLTEALKAVVVRSANDATVAVAEHLGGTEPAFADRMNLETRRLGMTATRFANATGLTAPGQLTTARDMAVLALALRRDFPAQWPLFSARAVEWKKTRLPTVNAFLAAYPGAEGMKTGFTCPAGYNLAAAASRGGRNAVAVVLGARSKAERATLTARLLDRAFQDGALQSGGDSAGLNQLANLTASPPDLSAAVCGAGVPGESAADSTRVPPGWAIEVAFGRDHAAVRRQLAVQHKALGHTLGGGTPVVVVRPFDGGLRYRGLIAGLQQAKAVPACLKLREQGEDRCMVLPPAAVEGAFDEQRRWRMLAAR